MIGRVQTLLRLLRARDRETIRAVAARGMLPAGLYRANALAIVRVREVRRLPRALDSLAVRWGGPGDEPLLQALRPREAGYRRVFKPHHALIIGTFNGEIATCNWIETGERHVSRTNGYTFEIGPGAAWAFGMEVAPRFRMSGAFHKHWVEVLRLLGERGIDRVYGAVQLDNPRSLNSHVRLGFEVLWRFRMIRVCGVLRYELRQGNTGDAPAVTGRGVWHGADLTAAGSARSGTRRGT